MTITDEQALHLLQNDATIFKNISLRINRYRETSDQRELDAAGREAERGFSVLRYAAEEIGLDLDPTNLELDALRETHGCQTDERSGGEPRTGAEDPSGALPGIPANVRNLLDARDVVAGLRAHPDHTDSVQTEIHGDLLVYLYRAGEDHVRFTVHAKRHGYVEGLERDLNDAEAASWLENIAHSGYRSRIVP